MIELQGSFFIQFHPAWFGWASPRHKSSSIPPPTAMTRVSGQLGCSSPPLYPGLSQHLPNIASGGGGGLLGVILPTYHLSATLRVPSEIL